MRVVGARLAVKMTRIAVRRAVFALKTLLARPGFDQRAVDRQMLVGPEGPTRAYLLVIDRAPTAVQRALRESPSGLEIDDPG